MRLTYKNRARRLACLLTALLGIPCLLAAEESTNKIWNLGLSVNSSVVAGNTETIALDGSAKFTVGEDPYEFRAILSGKLGVNNYSNISESWAQGEIGYDHDLAGNVEGFVLSQLFYNPLAGILVRFNFGGGLKYTFFKETNKDELSLSAAYWPEFTRSANLLTDTFTHRLSGRLKFRYALTRELSLGLTMFHIPNIMDIASDFRDDAYLNLSMKINPWFKFTFDVADNYNNLPSAGVKNNDMSMTFGISLDI